MGPRYAACCSHWLREEEGTPSFDAVLAGCCVQSGVATSVEMHANAAPNIQHLCQSTARCMRCIPTLVLLLLQLLHI